MRLISSQQLATRPAPPARATTIPARPAPSAACFKTDCASTPAPPAGSKYPYCGAQVSFNFIFFHASLPGNQSHQPCCRSVPGNELLSAMLHRKSSMSFSVVNVIPRMFQREMPEIMGVWLFYFKVRKLSGDNRIFYLTLRKKIARYNARV